MIDRGKNCLMRTHRSIGLCKTGTAVGAPAGQQNAYLSLEREREVCFYQTQAVILLMKRPHFFFSPGKYMGSLLKLNLAVLHSPTVFCLISIRMY